MTTTTIQRSVSLGFVATKAGVELAELRRAVVELGITATMEVNGVKFYALDDAARAVEYAKGIVGDDRPVPDG